MKHAHIYGYHGIRQITTISGVCNKVQPKVCLLPLSQLLRGLPHHASS